MGCCVSTNKHPPQLPFPSKLKLHQLSSPSTRTPPPLDLETVKEVLSITPNPLTKPQNDPHKIISRHNSFKFISHHHTLLDDTNISENENISTTTFEDDENDVYHRKLITKSPSKPRNWNQVNKVSGSGQDGNPVRKSPVRGKERSPGRVSGRETGFGSSGRRSPGSGSVSAARSRSPAKRTAVGGGEVGRSLSGRRTGKSPGRVGSDLHERVRKPELRSGRGSGRFTSGRNKEESLDNPLVSLECFIFL